MSATSAAIPSPNPTSADWSFYVDNTQTFNITGLDGSPVPFTLGEIDQLIYYLISTLSVEGFALGFSSMLLIILTILTPLKKAKRPIFICNYIALVLWSARAIIAIGTFCNQFFYGVGENELGAYGQYNSSQWIGPTVFDLILSMIQYPFIFASLILQVRVVFAAEPTTQKIITVVLTSFALALTGLIMAWDVYGIRLSFNPKLGQLNTTVWTAWHIGFCVFIGISCLLFLYKLVITIYRRRRMGFKQFGPLQVLVIMFGQCLILPEAFLLADIPSHYFNGLTNIGVTLLLASLPISALWASHESEGTHRAAVTTTSSSVSGQSPPSSRFRRFFNKGSSKDSHSDNSDLEKASNFSDTKKSPSVEAATLTSSA